MKTALQLSPTKIILGIDPGTTVMGYGILEINAKKVKVLQYGVLNLSKYSSHAKKLQIIFERTIELIQDYIPDELAIEAPFHGKNVQSMLKLGRAQGVAIAAALSREIPYCEYAPKKVKQSVSGNGNASKEQIAKMLVQILKLTETPKLLDATDALAVALCHHYQDNGSLTNNSKAKGWEGFLRQNPTKIVKPKTKDSL